MTRLAGFLGSLLLSIPAVAAAAPCPAGVTEQLDGLYRQSQPGPVLIASQGQRFTPGLLALLSRAYALTPADGRFVDFDLFSGTQVGTFGAQVLGCTAQPDGALVARVAVRAGLAGRTTEPPQELRYVMDAPASGGWRIADIVYPGEPTFRLTDYLQQLLAPQP